MRVSFERLRERTDELELLISGLTMLALLALPGWLMERYQDLFLKLPLVLVATVQMAAPLVFAVAHVLAFCFMLHLAIRAYWVGLVGLRAAFPGGVRWEATRGMGPITRQRLQSRLPSLEQAIERSDRLASVLFAGISLSALTLLWLGLLATIAIVGAALVGGSIGATNAMLNGVMQAFTLLLIGAPVLLWLADAVLAARLPRLRDSRMFRGLVHGLGAVVRVFFPARLIGPVRLTVQTNTRPRLFLLVFVLLVVMIPTLGQQQFHASLSFDRFGSQRFVGSDDVAAGMRSRHYESLRIPRDRMQAVPMIPAPVVEAAWVPLFLPYWPVRDDQLLAAYCTGAGPSGAPGHMRGTRDACLQRLWAVRLNDVPVDLSDFFASERQDLGLRGLSGFVDMRGASAGPQRLVIVWRPEAGADIVVDDYVPGEIRYSVPFLWSPDPAQH